MVFDYKKEYREFFMPAQKSDIVDISHSRYHYEIHLNDKHKTEVSKLKTVIRHPVKLI